MADVVDDAQIRIEKVQNEVGVAAAAYLKDITGNTTEFCITCNEEIEAARIAALHSPLRCITCQNALNITRARYIKC